MEDVSRIGSRGKVKARNLSTCIRRIGIRLPPFWVAVAKNELRDILINISKVGPATEGRGLVAGDLDKAIGSVVENRILEAPERLERGEVAVFAVDGVVAAPCEIVEEVFLKPAVYVVGETEVVGVVGFVLPQFLVGEPHRVAHDVIENVGGPALVHAAGVEGGGENRTGTDDPERRGR